MKKSLLLITAMLTAMNVGAQVRPVEEVVGSKAKAALTRVSGKAVVMKPSVKDATANTFFEDFEGYYGGKGWIPYDWTEVSKKGHDTPESAYDIDLTWYGSYGNIHTVPFEGESFMYIKADAAYSGHDIEEQDEWLITPQISVVEGNLLYFMLSYSPYAVRYNNQTGGYDAQKSVLEVLVSSDGGNTWNKEWDVMEDASKYTDDELLNDLLVGFDSYHPYIPVYINLDKYAGQDVKIALRYYGSGGSDMCVDNFTIGLPSPVAGLTLPKGVFMSAFSKMTDIPQTPMLLVPSTEIQWGNVSKYANTYQWDYAAVDGSMTTTTDEVLTTPAYASNMVVPSPKLTASYNNGNETSVQSAFSLMSVESPMVTENTEGIITRFGAGNYDWTDAGARFTFNRVAGFDINSCDKWCGFFMAPPDFYTPTAIANIYDRPLQPYALSQVYASAKIDSLREDAVLSLTIYTYLENEGSRGFKIASGSCRAADIVSVEGGYSYMTFNIDGGTQMISDAIIVEIGGFDLEKDGVYFPCVLTANNNNLGNSYMRIHDNMGNTDIYYPLCNVPGFEGDAHMAGILMGLDAAHRYIYSKDGDNTFTAEAEASSKTFSICSSEGVDWQIQVSDESWITADRVDGAGASLRSDLVVSVSELPEGITSREGTVTLTDGDKVSCTISVKQSDITGIAAVETSQPIQVVAQPFGIRVLHAANARRVSVYNVAGQRLGVYSVTNGTLIPASTAGAYVLRFDNATTVKVVK